MRKLKTAPLKAKLKVAVLISAFKRQIIKKERLTIMAMLEHNPSVVSK